MIRAILTDIEGTTSSISFVRDVLFPYAAQHLPMFVRANAKDAAVAEQLKLVAQEAGVAETDYPAIIDTLQRWIAEDRKITPLKALQGMLWEHGYRNRDYRAHVYPDAFEQLQRWHDAGVPLYVYSSGSIQAQKLFFAYSEFGDMTRFFSGYFDTTSGSKQEVASYQRIAAAIGIPGEDILFLSDIVGELDAAKQAGLQTCWLVRPADVAVDAAMIAASHHSVAKVFSEILLS
ncbi:MAG TPA: acireductone synthase [Pseudomonadales bacterium]|nr:acireductone synthase [Pseudomonadales bacterium]